LQRKWKLKAEGKFPGLETLLAAIAEEKAEFAAKILAVRRGIRREAVSRSNFRVAD